MASSKQNQGASEGAAITTTKSPTACVSRDQESRSTAITALLTAEIQDKAAQFALYGSRAYSCSFNDGDEHLFLIKVARRVHIYFLWNIKVTDVISGEGGVHTAWK